ncbi:MAG TPA: SAM-dependent methyltransferase [Actinomycetales bacterium]|nr:SAM-dependent methyltransferase [Actinomycetales bacterium]
MTTSMQGRPEWLPWREAWQHALYGPHGFYRRPEGPAGHFRTASHASPRLLASALARLARAAGCTTVVDVGAGRGELLAALVALQDENQLDADTRLVGVEVASRPASLDPRVGWAGSIEELQDRLADRLPDGLDNTLLIGWELLDVVPCTVLEVDGRGVVREVQVAGDGRERLGPAAKEEDLAWCRRWWPLDDAPAGTRAEVGLARDRFWNGVVDELAGGIALAVDYGHTRTSRPPLGSLTGFREGRQVPPVPDGTTDITAHVAVDSLAASLVGSFPDGGVPRARTTLTCPQREALSALGVRGRRPDIGLATTDPKTYVRRLQEASEAAELRDPAGLGGFSWVLHALGGPAAAALEAVLGQSDSTTACPT